MLCVVREIAIKGGPCEGKCSIVLLINLRCFF